MNKLKNWIFRNIYKKELKSLTSRREFLLQRKQEEPHELSDAYNLARLDELLNAFSVFGFTEFMKLD